MPVDRRGILRGLGGSAALAGLGGVRRVSELVGSAGRPRVQRFGDLVSSGDGDGRTRPVEAARPFALVAARTPPGAEVAVRVSPDGSRFGPWRPLEPADVEREGPEGAEARAAGNAWMRHTTPVWTGPASWLQLHVRGADPRDVDVVAVDAEPRRTDAAAATWPATAAVTLAAARPRPATDETADATLPVSGGLRIVTRQEWGADESLRRGDPAYADRVLHGVVHHTAGNNDYAPEDGPRIVRAIHDFHVRVNGWNDIGYNLLVDRYGVIYEGRFGGLDLPVIGAHARGANTGSFGVAVIGDFRWEELGWPEPRTALFELLAWKFGLHAIDPLGTVTTISGQPDVPTLAGHRDVGSTACPGDQVHRYLATWREGLAKRLPSSLTDIDGHPHEDAIRRLRAAGITTGFGDGTFRPDRFVTRGQMATFLTRAAQLPPAGDAPFSDVPAGHAHHDGIAATAGAGIAAGRSDGTFRPGDQVTRAQMASFLARAVELEPRDGATFPDVSPDDTHHGAIEAVAHAGIARGYTDGTFRPDDPVSRGQMAAFLVRAFELPELGDEPRDADELDDPDEELDDEEHGSEDVDPDEPKGGDDEVVDDPDGGSSDGGSSDGESSDGEGSDGEAQTV